jgi:hypothetical protein
MAGQDLDDDDDAGAGGDESLPADVLPVSNPARVPRPIGAPATSERAQR